MANDKHRNKTYSLRINENLMEELKEIAVEENRSVNNLIEYTLSKYVSDRATSKKEED